MNIPGSFEDRWGLSMLEVRALDIELRSRVHAYMKTRQALRAGRMAAVKCLLVLGWAAGSYAWFVFGAPSLISGAAAGCSLALALAAVGFNIQHDGNHSAFAGGRWPDLLAGFTLDLMGGSSHIWRIKHNILHHAYTNCDGMDDALDAGALGRLAPTQQWRRLHRWQHSYLWVLYGFIGLKWQFLDDFIALATGQLRTQRLGMASRDYAGLIAGKLAFVTLAFVIPASQHSLAQVLIGFIYVSALWGWVLSVVFQLSHCVPLAEQCEVSKWSRNRCEWFMAQLRSTVDFAPMSRLVTWYTGGLNLQVEHHLFPTISHVHYPVVMRIVREVLQRQGIRPREYGTVVEAIRAHHAWLRALGRPPRTEAIVTP